MSDYPAYPKTARWLRPIVITEKIDGTNGLLWIREVTCPTLVDGVIACHPDGRVMELRAGSRERWVTPGKSTDNYGFADWAYERAADLVKLGPGNHYGEWWGRGIQRNYGQTSRTFSLFNVAKAGALPAAGLPDLGVVPTLYSGLQVPANGVEMVQECLRRLRYGGSVLVPGWSTPEGLIVFHAASRTVYKVTLQGDNHKG